MQTYSFCKVNFPVGLGQIRMLKRMKIGEPIPAEYLIVLFCGSKTKNIPNEWQQNIVQASQKPGMVKRVGKRQDME